MKKKFKKLRSAKNRRKIKYLSRHPFVVPVVTFVVLFFAALVGFVVAGGQTMGATDVRVVQVHVEGETQVVPTRARTVEDLLDRLQIEVEEKDIVEPSLNADITDDNFQINVYKARTVLIEDEGKRMLIHTAATAPKAIAEAAGLKLFPEDIIEKRPLDTLEPADAIRKGVVAERVVIARATPVSLNIFGTQVQLRTHAETVRELLAERNLANVSVLPAEDTKLSDNLSVYVTEPGKTLRVAEEEIPFEVEYVQDHNIAFGEEVVTQQGATGLRAVVYEIDANGAESVFNEVIVRNPVKQIVSQGRRLVNINVSAQKRELMAAAGIPAAEHQYADFIISSESGWNVTARNRNSGAYGLCQALPGSKMASAGGDWETNAITQLRWCTGYASSRYGSWATAYNFWAVNHWW